MGITVLVLGLVVAGMGAGGWALLRGRGSAAYLWVRQGDQAHTINIPQRGLRIGRSKNNDLVLSGLIVSRSHARIMRRGEGHVIEDLSSKTGTFVNHNRTAAQAVRRRRDRHRRYADGVPHKEEPMKVESASVSDTGRRRPHNEDYLAQWEPDTEDELHSRGSLYVVADGVGGAAAGEVASRYGAERVIHDYFMDAEPDPEERLASAVEQAGAAIYEYNQAHPERREMASTLVAAAILSDELILASVGDSRGYLLRGGELEQLTRDHNVAASLLAQGEITAEEAANHPGHNRLTRSLGSDPSVGVDTSRHVLQEGDAVILCSDGLTRYVTDAEIASIAGQARPESAARRLVATANERGGADNISVIVLRMVAEAPRRARRPRTGLPEPDLDTTYHRLTEKRRWPWPFGRR